MALPPAATPSGSEQFSPINVSRRTAAFHLDNAKMKFGVRTICQAVAKLAASKSTRE
jgi:hypothetical protein